jgi:hypothetical protein
MRWSAATVICLLMGAASGRATVLVPADLAELTRDARTIARGRVVAVDARWLDARRGIETIVTLEADSYLKGALGSTVQFRVPGGELGRYAQVVVGAPTFSEGQQVIVFLGARGPSMPWLLGLSQGVYRVAEERGRAIVRAAVPVRGVAAAAAAGRPRAAASTGLVEHREPMALAAFEQAVRRLAAAPARPSGSRAVPR